MSAPTPPPVSPDSSRSPDGFSTLGKPAEAELKIQRSRFIAIASPAEDETQVKQLLAETSARFHDARHICQAWRLGVPPEVTEYRNDDGEPGGTAGEPILTEIRKRDLTRTVVLVVRYFGGIKLGPGGLARAYGQAAAAALDLAPVRTVIRGRRFRLGFPYARQKTLTHLLGQYEGQIRQEAYGVEVSWLIWLPLSRCEEFAAALRETTAGSVDLHPDR